MKYSIKLFFFSLCILGLICSCSPTDPSKKATEVVDQFLTAMVNGDTTATENIIEPSWFEKKAKETDLSAAEYKKLFLEFFNKQIEAKPLKTYTIKNVTKISDTKFEIDVEEETSNGDIENEKLIVVKVSNAWYLSADNLSPSQEEAPSEVTAVLSAYMDGGVKKDMMSVMDLVDPALFNDEAEALGMTPDEYKTYFGETFNKELGKFEIQSYSFTETNKISDNKWEITVEQNILEDGEEGVAVEVFIVTKIGNRWYIDRENFYGEDE